MHNIYPRKPSWGRKPNKNFLNIDSQWNAKTIKQTLDNILSQVIHLSIFFILQLQLQTCTLNNQRSEWTNEALASFIYTN